MILIEKRPGIASVAKYVDRYQLFIIQEPAFLKTIPNGKIECYLVKDGEFVRWDLESQSFGSCGMSGILPATNQASFYHIPSRLICLNVKLNLNLLGLSPFSMLLTSWEDFDVSILIPEIDRESILAKISENHPAVPVAELDTILDLSLKKHSIDEKIDKVVTLIEDRITSKFKVTDLASSMNMSEKSMERWVRKVFNLTTKELWQIIRFQHASHNLKNQPNRRFIDALQYGYYDQSHFIKECRKITDYSPKELFSKMKLPTNDLVFE